MEEEGKKEKETPATVPGPSPARKRKADLPPGKPLPPSAVHVAISGIPTDAAEADLSALLAPHGGLLRVAVIRQHASAPRAAGAGQAWFGDRASATRAVDALSGVYTWEGLEAAMTLTFKETGGGSGPAGPARARDRDRERDRAPPRDRDRDRDRWGPPPPQSFGGGPRGAVDAPPPGCAPDTYKLFVSALPPDTDMATLRAVLEQYGPVGEAVWAPEKGSGGGAEGCFRVVRPSLLRRRRPARPGRRLPGHRQAQVRPRPSQDAAAAADGGAARVGGAAPAAALAGGGEGGGRLRPPCTGTGGRLHRLLDPGGGRPPPSTAGGEALPPRRTRTARLPPKTRGRPPKPRPRRPPPGWPPGARPRVVAMAAAAAIMATRGRGAAATTSTTLLPGRRHSRDSRSGEGTLPRAEGMEGVGMGTVE